MDEGSREALSRLVEGRRVAALGTLHDGAPFVSMVPYAVSADGSRFYLHVSSLASHTQDMRGDARVSLMIMEADEPGRPAQALPRVTVQAEARELEEGSPEGESAASTYLARFPQSAVTFGLADFSLVELVPASARFVGGFARAFSLTPEELSEAIGSKLP